MSKKKAIRDRIKDFRRVKASELFASPRNWREHPKAQQAALRGILEDVGYADALLARELPDGTLELVDGHLRKETTPDQEVPVLVLDIDEDEAKKLLAVIDPLAAMAEANTDALGSLLAEIGTESDALQAMLDDLADANDIDLDGNDPGDLADPEPQVDRAAELQKEWGTETGQLWVIPGKAGEHRLLCGDCRKDVDVSRLCVEKVNGCFTSPPYAEQRKYDEASEFKPIPPGEYVDWWEPLQANIRGVLADDGSFFVNIKPNCVDGERVLYVFDLVLAMKRLWSWGFVDEFCWERVTSPGSWTNRFKNGFEPVLHFALSSRCKFRPHNCLQPFKGDPSKATTYDAGTANKVRPSGFDTVGSMRSSVVDGALPSNVIQVSGSGGLGHSAAFPAGLPSFFIKAFSDDGDRWLDPFLGSGTTMVAAENLGRICYGMEISAAYTAVILERMKSMDLEPVLSD